MKKVITYGTYDLLHRGHIALLERAKKLGDHLIVGVTSDAYDKSRGKLNVQQSLIERIENVKATGLADQIIVEEYDGQKISDILKYDVDIFTVGSDWVGKFDYLKEYCQVTYLDRTEGVSSTELRVSQHPIVRFGLVGLQNPVDRFIAEADAVKGVEIKAVYAEDKMLAATYATNGGLTQATSISAMDVDAVYICEPVDQHAAHIKEALEAGFHVICESPLFLTENEAEEIYAMADAKDLVVFEAIKTAYYPAFDHLLLLIKTGIIGEVKDIDVSFSKVIEDAKQPSSIYQDSLHDLIAYVMCPILKILGTEPIQTQLYSYQKDGYDLFTRGILQYPQAVASFKTGKGIKTEGEMIITGTRGYFFVPAPWWQTEYFELRKEDLRNTRKYFYKCEGSGLRYEILEFLNTIHSKERASYHRGRKEVMAVTKILEMAKKNTQSI